MNVDSIIAALEKEARGYINRGLMDRAKQVDEQLVALGRAGVVTRAASSVASPQRDSTKKPKPKAKAAKSGDN